MGTFGYFVVSAGLFIIYMLSSRGFAVRLFGRIVTLVLAVAASALTIFLIGVGNHNNWSSDGPGILMVMIGVFIFGLAAFALWGLLVASLSDYESEPEDERRKRIAAGIQELRRVAPGMKFFLNRRHLLLAAVVFLSLGLLSVVL